MSRIPLPYSPKVMDLFRNPKNLGKIEDATVTAVAGNPACGDMITFYLKINEQTYVIEKAQFESYGCAANIATSSIVTEMIRGLTLEAVWTDISWEKVAQEIGGLPSVKSHCGVLAVGALRRAIRKYFSDKGNTPAWMPEENTFEEKQALEEEELVETLSTRLKPEEEKSP
ncbi:MAG: iron-sulfur cluster assembly scaffold protein [Candidatus Bathyarchaeota archaeon]|nr:iron-sulfur cluster assembly scaffold protein [Candidatus Termiticorpusculum sp.]